MEDEKLSSGQLNSTNNNNNNDRSLADNQTKQANNNSISSKMDQRPSSSTSSHKQAPADDSFSGDGDDVGWWDCSLCTYRNSADKFKCEICDLRRGTSTRKPRCNADTIVAQVVKQQEQIRQQTRVRTPKVRSSTGLNAATSSNDLSSRAKSQSKTMGLNKNTRLRDEEDDDDNDDNDDDESVDSETSVLASQPQKRKKKVKEPTQGTKKNGVKKKSKTNQNNNHDMNNGGNNVEDDDDEDYSDFEESSTVFASSREGSPASSETSVTSSQVEDLINSTSSSSSNSPEPTTSSPALSTKTSDNPFKITSLEVNGNLIKYSPPTSSGRTGLIIDKKRFTQQSVTVNDVTITFTEFATRQNRYVRKKTKRRDNTVGGGSSSGKTKQ